MRQGRCFRPQARIDLRQRVLDGPPLVLVTGSAGVGKSWLAAQVCTQLEDEGAVARHFVVPLAGEARVDAWWPVVARTVAEATQSEGPGPSPLAVARWLEAVGPSVLCLDTDVAPASAAGELTAWLDQAPSCRVVLVSRRGFDGDAIQRFDVAPLATPSEDGLTGPAADYWLHLLERMAIEVVEQERAAHVEIVRNLDGLPLAMDLAAPRLRVMRPTVLLHRLRRSRSLLTGNQGTSFDVALERSWQVLGEDERSALIRLSVATSPFSLGTAEAVLGERPNIVAQTLERLEAEGWLRSGPEGLVLLATLGDFVRRRSEPQLRIDAEVRLARDLLEHEHPDARRQRDQLVARAAAGPLRSRTHAEAMLALVARDPTAGPLLPDGMEATDSVPATLIDAVLDSSRDSGADPKLWADAWIARAAEAVRCGGWTDAERALGRAARLIASLGDASRLAWLSLARAHLELAKGNAESALRIAQEARAQMVAQRDEPGELRALAVLAEAQTQLGDAATSAELWARLITHSPHLGWTQAARVRGAWTLLDMGDVDQALAWLQPIEHGPWLVLRRTLQAWAAHDAGDFATADHRYREATQGSGIRLAMAMSGWGLLRLTQGSGAEAWALFREARKAAEEAVGGEDWTRLAAVLERSADIGLPAAVRSPREMSEGGLRASRAGRLATALEGEVSAMPPGILQRLVERACGAAAQVSDRALEVQADGRWFCRPGAEPVSLAHRPVVARVLRALVQQRRAQPGAVLSYEELVHEGWLGERMRPDAGVHRVRVAISTLRKLGLREFLMTAEGGYRLDPDCPLVVAPN